MIYGYARVSSTDQNIGTQIKELDNYTVDKIISEKTSGVNPQKSELDNLLQILKKDDTLVITRMDRLGRDTLQLLKIIDELDERSINFVILNLGIDTRTSIGKFFLTVMASFSDLERTMIKQKQLAGVQLAKEKGIYKGRPASFTLNSPKIQHAIKLRDETNITVKEISKIIGVSEATLYRRLKDYKEVKERTLY